VPGKGDRAAGRFVFTATGVLTGCARAGRSILGTCLASVRGACFCSSLVFHAALRRCCAVIQWALVLDQVAFVLCMAVRIFAFPFVVHSHHLPFTPGSRS
jgi:hypothetical protein